MSMNEFQVIAAKEDQLLAAIGDIQIFEKEHKLISRFNFFDAVQMTRQEIRHSRFLAFLLDPKEAHGLGDEFMRAVLMASANEHPCLPVSRLDLSLRDFSDAIIYCERDHFDISIQIPSLKLLFVIENKIDAVESFEQLRRYRELAEKRYSDYKFMGCFLTPEGYGGEDEQWGILSYGTIANELQRLMDRFNISDDVGMAIRQYISLIERRVIVSDSLRDACRQIYRKHKAALDCILEYGQFSELEETFEEVRRENWDTLKLKRRGASYLLFEDAKWQDDFPEFLAADKSLWGSDFPIHYRLDLTSNKLFLKLVVGPLLPGAPFSREDFIKNLRAELNKKDRVIGTSGRTKIDGISSELPEDFDTEDLKKAMNLLYATMFDRTNNSLARLAPLSSRP